MPVLTAEPLKGSTLAERFDVTGRDRDELLVAKSLHSDRLRGSESASRGPTITEVRGLRPDLLDCDSPQAYDKTHLHPHTPARRGLLARRDRLRSRRPGASSAPDSGPTADVFNGSGVSTLYGGVLAALEPSTCRIDGQYRDADQRALSRLRP